jgi:hypothetical protein
VKHLSVTSSYLLCGKIHSCEEEILLGLDKNVGQNYHIKIILHKYEISPNIIRQKGKDFVAL